MFPTTKVSIYHSCDLKLMFVKRNNFAFDGPSNTHPSVSIVQPVLGHGTHPALSDVGFDLFCPSNLEKAMELFKDEHICNDFCKWPGFKLSPFRGNGKSKGKASDPVIVS